MCLARLQRFKKQRYGYKIFKKHAGFLYGEYTGRRQSRPTGVWLDAVKYRYDTSVFELKTRACENYYNGWHVYAHHADAIAIMNWHDKVHTYNLVIRKVAIKHIMATGYQGSRLNKTHVIVCRKIKI